MNKRVFIVTVVISLFAIYLHLFPFHEVVPLKKDFKEFPMNWKGWNGNPHFFDEAVLENLKVSEYMLRQYRKGDEKVTIYIGYYGSQKEGAQIHSPKNCLPGGGWLKLSETLESIDINGVGTMSFVEAVYQKGHEKELFIYWYKMKNAYITNEYVLKLYMIFNSLKYGRNDAAFIRISRNIIGNRNNSIESARDFMKDFLPLLGEYLPE